MAAWRPRTLARRRFVKNSPPDCPDLRASGLAQPPDSGLEAAKAADDGYPHDEDAERRIVGAVVDLVELVARRDGLGHAAKLNQSHPNFD